VREVATHTHMSIQGGGLSQTSFGMMTHDETDVNLIGNFNVPIDRAPNVCERQVSYQEAYELAQFHGILYIETSV